MKIVDILAAIGLVTVVKWGINIALKVEEKKNTNKDDKSRD